MRKRVVAGLLWGLALVACDAADDVEVLPLPSLEAASPEARAGLPVISGVWRFAGWELAPGDTGRVEGDLPGFGELRLETQRLDSIAGFYISGDARVPVIGEIRRDSVMTLAGGGRFLAGRVATDTFWLSMTSLVESGGWPDEARAAFVRSAVDRRFVRVKGQRPALAMADTVGSDSMRLAAAEADTASGPGPVVVRRGLPLTPGRTAPTRTAETTPAPATPQRPAPQRAETETPPARRAEEQQAEQPPAPQPQQQAEPREQAEPDPEPEPETPRRRTPVLLGEPIDSLYSPTAARAMSRPGPVKARR